MARDFPDLLSSDQWRRAGRDYKLTGRELDVCRGVARGLGTSELAQRLFVSREALRSHLKRVYRKTGVADRTSLVLLFVHGYLANGQTPPAP